LISIDIGDLKDEVNDLQEFLKGKLIVDVKVEGKTMNVGAGEEKLSRGIVKDYVERFFYRKDLSDVYKVANNKDAFKIVKKKT
jgi:hypothetical protein